MNNMTFRPVGTAVAAAALAVVAVMLVMAVPASAQQHGDSCYHEGGEYAEYWASQGLQSCEEVAREREASEAAERGYSVGATPPRCAWYGGDGVAYRIDNNCSGEYTEDATVYPDWMTTRRQTVGQQDRNRGVTGQGVTAWGEVYPEVDKEHQGYLNDRSLRLDGHVVGTEVVFDASRAGLGGGVIPLYEAFEYVDSSFNPPRITLRYRLPDGTEVRSPGGGVTDGSVCLRPQELTQAQIDDTGFHACKTKHRVTFGGSTYELEELIEGFHSDGRVLVNIVCISGACKETST